jgi:hypothetical protein
MLTYVDVNQNLPSMKDATLAVSECVKKDIAVAVLEAHVPLYVAVREKIEDLERSIKSEVDRLETDAKAHNKEIKLAMSELGKCQFTAWDGSAIHLTHTRKVLSKDLSEALASGQIRPLHSDVPLVEQLLAVASADSLIKIFGEDALQGFITKKPYAVKRGIIEGRE